jgi:hypothetical protein
MKAALLGALLVTGCSLFQPKATEYVPYQVKVPVEVPCAADLPPKPAWATDALHKADSGDDKVKALLVERTQRAGYEDQLEKATEGCR